MDIKSLIDAFGEAARQERSKYQMTISDAIQALRNFHSDAPCRYEDGGEPGEAMSYRGYYSDLAFADRNQISPATAGDVLAALRIAEGQTFHGYKGGDFLMGSDTVIWRSAYGDASGMAWMDIEPEAGACVIKTKLIE